MISKELLSEVLGYEIKAYRVDKGYVDYQYASDNGYDDTINIHELAHKVKEWAMTKGYSTFSYNEYDDLGWSVQMALYGEEQHTKWSSADTEPEAVFKAGQWILENR